MRTAHLLAFLAALVWGCSDDGTSKPRETGPYPDIALGDQGLLPDQGPMPEQGPMPDQGPVGDGPGTALKISDIQDTSSPKHPAEDTVVTVSGVITAVSARQSSSGEYVGFFVQDPAGGPYSGIYVYHAWNDTATLKPAEGDEIEITGTYTEYYDVSELKDVTWTKKGTATVPAPVQVAAADVATSGTKGEQYEGVLIEVANLEIDSFVKGSGGTTNVAFVDKTTGLQVDYMLYDFLNPTPPPVGTTYSKVVGPLHYAYDNFKVAPRKAADLVP